MATGWPYYVVEAVVGAYSAYETSQQKAPDIKPPAPQQPPQQAKSPDVGGIMAGVQGQNGRGVASTFLTGPAGVDPAAVSLSKPSLLGS